MPLNLVQRAARLLPLLPSLSAKRLVAAKTIRLAIVFRLFESSRSGFSVNPHLLQVPTYPGTAGEHNPGGSVVQIGEIATVSKSSFSPGTICFLKKLASATSPRMYGVLKDGHGLAKHLILESLKLVPSSTERAAQRPHERECLRAREGRH